MRWTRRRVQTVATWVVVVAWVVFYAVALVNADPPPPLETAVVQLVVPPLLWVVAARLVLRHWWSGPGSPRSGMDTPGPLDTVRRVWPDLWLERWWRVSRPEPYIWCPPGRSIH